MEQTQPCGNQNGGTDRGGALSAEGSLSQHYLKRLQNIAANSLFVFVMVIFPIGYSVIGSESAHTLRFLNLTSVRAVAPATAPELSIAKPH